MTYIILARLDFNALEVREMSAVSITLWQLLRLEL